MNKETVFDFAKIGSSRIFRMTVRVIRLKLPDGSFTCLVTSLPKTEFPAEEISSLYQRRWTEETAFSELKCSIGLEEVHSAKPEYVQQEIWGKLTAFNFVSAVRNEADRLIPADRSRKYNYEADFSYAVRVCLRFLIRTDPRDDELPEAIARRHHAVRPGRTACRGRPRSPGPCPLNHRAA